jgi:hypothetical protein
MRTLIKTLTGESGEIYAIRSGQRILLAKCEPEIRVYEHSQRVSALGVRSYRVKTRSEVTVICAEPECTREVDAHFLQGVSRFELAVDLQTASGDFRRFTWDAAPTEIDLRGDWEFEVIGQGDLARDLL